MVPNAEVVAQQSIAFDGTVTTLADGVVTLTPTHWYAGDATDLVRVQAPSDEMQDLVGAVDFEDGGPLPRLRHGRPGHGLRLQCAVLHRPRGHLRPGVPRLMHGLLLAAGAGTRMGMPKALVRDGGGGSWLVRGVRTLVDGGCAQVTVVLGAAAEEALPLLDGTVATAVVAADWADGMSASLRAGLAAATGTDADAVVVSLVDLPDVGADVVRRLLDPLPSVDTLRRASYDGRPGHPVVIGREHWPRSWAAPPATAAPATTWRPTTPRWSSAATWPPAATSTSAETHPNLGPTAAG